MMSAFLSLLQALNWIGSFLPQLGLRVILAYEFWEAGYAKYNGQNWFEHIQDKFPFPFSMVPVDISWAMATWFELIGAVALLIGLATRFFAVSLIILTIVAAVSVHLPPNWMELSLAELWQGYAITDKGFGNFKLPLLYLIMLLPLLFSGSGKFSLDHVLWRWFMRPSPPFHPNEVHK